MLIEDDGVLPLTVKRPDGSEVTGKLPVYELFNRYADLAAQHPEPDEFWKAWREELAVNGLPDLSIRAAKLVYAALSQQVEDWRKKNEGSPSAS